MPQCARCGYSYDGDLRVCPKCKAALVSSDYKTALDSLSGYYDSDSSTFVHNESVVIFKGETKKEATERITKGKIRTAFIFGVIIFAVFGLLLASSIGKFTNAADASAAVAYTKDSTVGTSVSIEANSLVPLAEAYYNTGAGGKTVYCFARTTDKAYAVVAVTYEQLNGKYRKIQYGTDDFDETKSYKIKGVVTETGGKELSELKKAIDEAKMNFDPSRFISAGSDSSDALTGTVLLLLSCFVFGVGLIILSFGFRKARRQAKNVKNAFRKGNF